MADQLADMRTSSQRRNVQGERPFSPRLPAVAQPVVASLSLTPFTLQGRFDAAISKVCFGLLLETFTRTIGRDLGEPAGEEKGDGKLIC